MPRKVIVLGDVMLDRTTRVHVRGPSPENSGVLVVNDPQVDQTVGGAANVANTVKALGVDPFLIGFNRCDYIDKYLYNRCIEFKFVAPYDGTTPIKNRIVTEDGHPLLRIDEETPWANGGVFWTRGGPLQMALHAQFETRPLPVVGVVDYDKGSVSEGAVECLMSHVRGIHESYRTPVIVDPGRGGDWKRFSSPHTIFKVNAKQCYQQRAWGSHYHGLVTLPAVNWGPAQPTTTCRDLFDRVRINLQACEIEYAYLVITLGAGGIIAGSRTTDSHVIHTSSSYVHGADVCGAGDTVMSALLAYFAHQETGLWEWGNMVSAVQYAQEAAQVAVKHRGVYVVRKEELPGWPSRLPL